MTAIVTILDDAGRKITETYINPRTEYRWHPAEPVADRDGVPYLGFILRPILDEKE